MSALLLPLLLAAVSPGMRASPQGLRPEAAIRAARAQSNAAIAAHDYDAMRRFFLPDYTILPGSSGAPLDAEANRRRIMPTFADPGFVTYVRTPERVRISGNGKRAAETGRWVGLWQKPDGAMRLSGIYQATWMPAADGWRLKNESFVSLRCTGSRACGEVD